MTDWKLAPSLVAFIVAAFLALSIVSAAISIMLTKRHN